MLTLMDNYIDFRKFLLSLRSASLRIALSGYLSLRYLSVLRILRTYKVSL